MATKRKKFTKYKNIFGVKLGVKFTPEQIQLIKQTSIANDNYYNVLVDAQHRRYEIKRILQATQRQAILRLERGKNITTQLDMINHYYDQLQYLKELTSTSRRTLVGAINTLTIDSHSIVNTQRNYQAAWNLYAKIRRVNIPKKHLLSVNNFRYQTNALYSSKLKNDPNLINGSIIYFLDQTHLCLPKLGTVQLTKPLDDLYWQHRDEIRMGTVTIRLTEDGHQFVSILFATDIDVRRHHFKPTEKSVGIDLNLDNFATFSTGRVVEMPHFYRKAEPALQKKARELDWKRTCLLKQGKTQADLINCKNYQRVRQRYARMCSRVRNQRDSFLDELALEVIRDYDFVVLENLQSKSMLKNHHLAKSISDAGWRTFIAKVQSKANQYGKTVVLVNPANTTQTCSHCGYICGSDERKTKLTLNEREWDCPNCHTHHIRDVNAAQNILRRGQKQYAEATKKRKITKRKTKSSSKKKSAAKNTTAA